MNIDFANHAGFSAYVLLLMFSGLAMLAMGTPAMKGQGPLQRVLNIAFGLGFFAYGFYLTFIFTGGTYVIFFKVFLVPVLMVVRTIQSSRRARSSVPGVGPSVARPQYEPWRQSPAIESWTPPPPPLSVQPNCMSELDGGGAGRHRDRSESP